MNDFSRRIMDFVSKANGAKKKVALFFLSNPNDVAFLTLDKISKKIGVSASTITRTASDLGFSGYPGLQEEARNMLLWGLDPLQRLDQSPVEKDSLGIHESVALDRVNLEGLLSEANVSAIEQAVQHLATKRRVFIMGLGSSYSLAFLLSAYLRRMRPGCVRLVGLHSGNVAEYLMEITADDAFVVFSFPRYSMQTLDFLEEVEKIGCTRIAVTDSSFAPVAMKAQIVIATPCDSVSFFNSNLCGVAVVNALLTGLHVVLDQGAVDHLNHYNQFAVKYDVKDNRHR